MSSSSSSTPTSFNPDQYKITQRQSWDSAASGWKKWWQVIEKGAQKINNRLVELAEIKPGYRVLDIATGAGEPAVTAAKVVGGAKGRGHVLAEDISSQMLVIAKERAASLNLQHVIEFREGDIESLELPPTSFDAILCRWGLMFLPKLDSTLKHIFDALVNNGDGKFAAAVWSIPSKVPFVGLPMSIVMRHLQIPQPTSGIPGPFSLADDNILEGYLSKAGFRNIHIERQNVTFEFASVKDYISNLQDVAAPIKAILDKEPDNRRIELWKLMAEEISKSSYTNADDGSVRMDNECICVVGTK